MKKLLFLFLLIPSFLFSQADTTKGIHFEQGLTWKQVKQKAKQENKYIFLDAYTTWCVPCRQMDRNVYTNDTVGAFMNDKFINVKMQFDKTEKDNEQIRREYATADSIQKKYPLQGFPSFLFFDPNANLLYKKVGYHDTQEFIQIAKESHDPKRKEIYTAIQEYKQGRKNYAKMPELIAAAKELLGDKDLSKAIAKDYKFNYLDSLDENQLFTRETLKFIFGNADLLSSKDKLFRLIYQKPSKADSIVDMNGFSARLINYIIKREEIDNKLQNNGIIINRNPNWNNIKNSISSKYGLKYSKLLVPSSQREFYFEIGDFQKYIQCIELIIKEFPPKKDGDAFRQAIGDTEGAPDSWALNSIAWKLFEKSTDKAVLLKALKWSDLSIQLEPHPGNIFQFYDTKANLVYKLAILYKNGKIENAIELEEKAIQLLKEYFEENKIPLTGVIDVYTATLYNMKNRIKTWRDK